MANALYDKGRESFLKGEIAWITDNIKAVAVDAGAYTPNLATHQFLSDIPGGARIGTSGNLANKTSAAGVADADDATITGITGAQFEYIALYQDTGNAATSRLICLIDTATGLAFTPSGGDLIISWDNGANKIFKL